MALFCYERTHVDAPWLTREAVRWLDAWLDPADAGLEWGSGRSTIWLAARTGTLTSVEHDPAWHARVHGLLEDRGFGRMDHRLVPVHDVTHGSAEHPYVALARQFPNSSLDYVLVDGIYRDYCVDESLEKLRPGGLLVLDNANWFLRHESRSPCSVGPTGEPPSATWGRVAERLRRFRCMWTSNGVTDTALFLKR